MDLRYFLQFGYYNLTTYTTTVMLGEMIETMSFQYLDGTDVNLTLEVGCIFWPGGVEVSSGSLPGSGSVLNWNDLASVDVGLETTAPRSDGAVVSDLYSFLGFGIVIGSALSFINLTAPGGGFAYGPTNQVASLNFGSQVGLLHGGYPGVTIGPVTLSARNATSQSGTVPQSIAQFNVSQPATIGGNTTTAVSVPAILSFYVSHNVTQTEWKVGLDVNWSAAPSFSTVEPFLSPGESYSLVGNINLAMGYSPPGPPATRPVGTFTTDAGNDSAIFSYDGTYIGRELTTTAFSLPGSSAAHNTSRVYNPHNSGLNGVYNSEIWVEFSGFQYGSSTGFSFDPAVITLDQVVASPPSPNSSLQTMLLLEVAGASVATAAVVVFLSIRRRKPPPAVVERSRGEGELDTAHRPGVQ